jgi:hypothetical protein
MAPCPAHEDREPSLAIREGDDGKILVRCHAGCNQDRVIAALRSRNLWEEKISQSDRFAHRAPWRSDNDQRDPDDYRRTKMALRLWRATAPAPGTPVETYLNSRGIDVLLPPRVRFHPGLKHPSGSIWPAAIALVTRGADDTPVAIHRTFLDLHGAGKAPVEPQKMMLGPCRGGAVRLAPVSGVLMVGEGIETCLAAMTATGNPAWAALSTSGLRTLELPNTVRDVIVLADGDDPGEAAARDCAWRWKREGRLVRIARPPRGSDFNDLLVARAPRIGEGAK